MLRRQLAIEIVPSSKPLRWRRYDIPQHLAPETSDALRFCAVEGDLDLLDRRHPPTLEAGLPPSPRPTPAPQAAGRACWSGLPARERLRFARTPNLERWRPTMAGFVLGPGEGPVHEFHG